MDVVTLYSPQRWRLAVERPHDDRGDRLVILAGWGQQPAEVYRAALPLLELDEVFPVARALGLPEPRSEPDSDRSRGPGG